MMNKFKDRRLDLNLKQQDVIKFTGINTHWMNKIEAGRLPTFLDKCGHVKKKRKSMSIGDCHMARLCKSHLKTYQDFESGTSPFVYGSRSRYLKNIKLVADELELSVSELVLAQSTSINKYMSDPACKFLLNFFRKYPSWISSVLGAWSILLTSE